MAMTCVKCGKCSKLCHCLNDWKQPTSDPLSVSAPAQLSLEMLGEEDRMHLRTLMTVAQDLRPVTCDESIAWAIKLLPDLSDGKPPLRRLLGEQS